MLINCDIGERGAAHPEDTAMMSFLDIANIACGGHAGDRASINFFTQLAEKHGVQISAHLSYPDPKNFGRLSMQIKDDDLLTALDEQRNMMPHVTMLKFHGALYNDAAAQPALARLLAEWAKDSGLDCIIAPNSSELSIAAKVVGLHVLAEVFAERNYQLQNDQLVLVDRKHPHASIQDLETALSHCDHILKHGIVTACLDDEGLRRQECPVQADTICIHSDSPIALPLAQALHHRAPPFDLTPSPLCSTVGLPVYGQQDIGISPGGAIDRFSFLTANRLLKNPDAAKCLEFILAPRPVFTKPCCCVLTGAAYKKAYLRRGHKHLPIIHGEVFVARTGDQLILRKKRYGLRTYLGWRVVNDPSILNLNGKFRGDFSQIATWPDAHGKIRVLEGPEFQGLENPRRFFSQKWTVSSQLSSMGMRLLRTRQNLKISQGSMISGPVSDGTIQLTPQGPIVLLRHRQTVGGYPRIFNVIDPDVDLLAQYRPNQTIQFHLISLAEAQAIKAKYNRDLNRLKKL